MKKKILMTVMSIAMVTGIITGCGSIATTTKEAASNKVKESSEFIEEGSNVVKEAWFAFDDKEDKSRETFWDAARIGLAAADGAFSSSDDTEESLGEWLESIEKDKTESEEKEKLGIFKEKLDKSKDDARTNHIFNGTCKG